MVDGSDAVMSTPFPGHLDGRGSIDHSSRRKARQGLWKVRRTVGVIAMLIVSDCQRYRDTDLARVMPWMEQPLSAPGT